MRQLRAVLAPEPGDPFPVRLTPTLDTIARALSTGRLVTYERLYALTWCSPEALKVHVCKLRKLGMRIKVFYGRGYQSDGWDQC